MLHSGILLRHHIHVPLQNHTRVVLHARAGGLANQYVAYLIGQGLQSERLHVCHVGSHVGTEVEEHLVLHLVAESLCRAVVDNESAEGGGTA